MPQAGKLTPQRHKPARAVPRREKGGPRVSYARGTPVEKEEHGPQALEELLADKASVHNLIESTEKGHNLVESPSKVLKARGPEARPAAGPSGSEPGPFGTLLYKGVWGVGARGWGGGAEKGGGALEASTVGIHV